MYIHFDYKCLKCDQTNTLMVKRAEMDSQQCRLCSDFMLRLPAGTRTTFRFADRKLKR